MKRYLKKSLALFLSLLMSLSALTCLAMAADGDDADESEPQDKVTIYITCDVKDLRPGDVVDVKYSIGPVENLTYFRFTVSEPEGLTFDHFTDTYHSSAEVMFNGEGEQAISTNRIIQSYAYYPQDAFSCDEIYDLFSARYNVSSTIENGEVTFGLDTKSVRIVGAGSVEVEVVSDPVEVVVVDTSELSRRITYAQQLLSMPDLYSTHSIAALEEAVEYAQSILDNIRDYRQTDVDDALEKLNAAIDNMKSPSEELDAAIEAAEKLRESDYTKDSWGNLTDALEAAKGIRDKEDATNDEMNAAADALYDAIDALEALPEEEALAASREKLQSDLEAAKALNESNYTADSWAVLQAAIQDAEEVLNNEDATKEELDNADDVLVDAVEGLVSVGGNSGTGGTTGTTGSNGGSGTGSGTTGGVKSPQTGDSSILLICMTVLAAGMLGCSAVCVSKARGNKE